MRPRLAVIALVAASTMAGCDDGAPTVQPAANSSTDGHSTASRSTAQSPPSPTTEETGSGSPMSAGSSTNLSGSRWSGTNSSGERMTLDLRSDGQFGYTTNGQQRDTTPGNDGWTQTGSKLVLEPNGGYAVYTGVVTGDRYVGTARNEVGKTWTFRFTRTN